MKETDSTKETPISKAQILDEVADYWDKHSLADHWEQTREAQFEVRAKRRRRIVVDPAFTRKSKPKHGCVGSLLKH